MRPGSWKQTDSKHVRVRESNTNVIPLSGLITIVKKAPLSLDTLQGRMRFARQLRGWTQKELARRAGMSQSTVGNVESGIRENPRSLVKLSVAAGCRFEWLSEREGPIYPPGAVAAGALEAGGEILTKEMSRTVTFSLSSVVSTANTGGLDGESVRLARVEVGLEKVEDGGPSWRITEEKPVQIAHWQMPGVETAGRKLAVAKSGDGAMRSIEEGDQVLVDVEPTAITDGCLYAMVAIGKLIIRRLYETPGGGLVMASDHALVAPTMQLSAAERGHVAIIGRVVYRLGGAVP